MYLPAKRPTRRVALVTETGDCVDIARATHDGCTVTADEVSGTLVFAVTATDSEPQTTTVDSEPYDGVRG
jgi:hypothetical protein